MSSQSGRLIRRRIRVHYPEGRGRIVLRTENDWERDLDPIAVSADGSTATFEVEARKPFLYMKPCLVTADRVVRWAIGPNWLSPMTMDHVGDVYPHFDGSGHGSLSEPIEFDSAILGRRHRISVYLPAGYAENTVQRHPVLYMQDGKNLFFPEEALAGHEWKVDKSLQLLDSTSLVERPLVVAIHSGEREHEYTKPGYEAYSRSVVEEIRPLIAREMRILDSPQDTAVTGSSLGGVVSFYMAWQYPHVFGYAACMSSTFSYRDDLIERVLAEPMSTARFYLDSGWPHDNYEVTLAMAMAFVERGYRVREDFLHLVFPLDEHDEDSWGRRLHLPLQLALGKSGVAHRRRVE